MKFLICAFSVILSIAVYPIIMLQNSELLYIFTLIELDFFNWYRMILVAIMGTYIPAVFFKFRFRDYWPLLVYLALLLISTLTSRYPETSLYGTPMHHEGLLAILGYIGIILIVKKEGIFPALEKCLDTVIFITASIAVLQIVYDNFLNFPLFKLLIPEVQMKAETWPIYANMGGPNNLGLFCALFTPYALIRKKWLQVVLLASLLIGCQSRAAWLSVIITTAIISRKYLLYAIIGLSLLSIPMRETITSRIIQSWNNIHWPIRDGDISGRAYMWKRAIPALKESIFIGKGPASYIHYVPQFHERGNAIGFQMQAIDRPHNMFINIWINSGLFSLLVISFWVLKQLKRGNDYSLKLGIIGYLIAGLFTDSVLCVTPYFSIFLGGLIYGSNDEARRHDKRTRTISVGNGASRDPISDAVIEPTQWSGEAYVP